MQLSAFLRNLPAGNYRPELVKVLLHIGAATQLAELPTRYNDILTKGIKQNVSNDSEARNFIDALLSKRAELGKWRR